jgi:uncharacterized beta barrel domain-containing protein DUF5777
VTNPLCVSLRRAVTLAALLTFTSTLALAQTPAPAAPQPERADPDVRIDPLQPDFTLATLPTTLRLPRHKMSFRVTHRFMRPLGQGDLGDLVGDGFGIDGSAQIGLELRYGLMSGTQVGIHRTSERTIQIFGQHNFLQQAAANSDGAPVGLDAIVTLEGGNNLRDEKKSVVGVIVSRAVGRFASIYAEPMVVFNANPFENGDNNTMLVGLGARLRLRPALYLVGEFTPRVAGYEPNVNQAAFGIEARAGGHLFQINFSNGFGTTLGQVASGGTGNDNWYFGFNIARKFF